MPPSHNGAPIIDYNVEMSIFQKNEFISVYHGLNTSCEVKPLLPNTSYLFRVQAVNNAGPSEYSPVCQTVTPPSAPAVVGALRYHATSNSLALSWVAPSDHGSEITHYNIDTGDKIVRSTLNEHTLYSLRPDTTYR